MTVTRINIQSQMGVKNIRLETQEGESEPKAIVELVAQGGWRVDVHLDADAWRWLAVDLEQKRQRENERLGIE
ncbi:hypothetical protein [Streptomyces chrestomyceticus]|uniref:hypothetical protein n=1 Tax=Streptomyces chrestomyceticus TaxID=68185 RepID=UPI0037A44C06